MKKQRMLFRSTAKKQMRSIISLFLMMLLSTLCLFTGITLYTSGTKTVTNEMNRLGFGDYTVWVNGNEAALAEQIGGLTDVEAVSVQPLVFSGYEINGSYSDNEGQLIAFDGSVPYRFVSEIGKTLPEQTIASGTIYISPALSSSFDVKIGDTVNFELTRSNGIKSFTVAGYFEDAFMGSSMIDMKSFLICPDDDKAIRETIQASDKNDVLAKQGAMLHITKNPASELTNQQLQRLISEQTDLSYYTEFSYSFASIQSYMLLLQNILCGFLLAFSLVLLLVCIVVVGHNLSAVIQSEEHNIAILKTIGLSGGSIRNTYLQIYGGASALAIGAALLMTAPLSALIAGGMVTSTGILVNIAMPYQILLPICLVLLALTAVFLFIRTLGILKVPPMRVLQSSGTAKPAHNALHKKHLPFHLALRTLLSGKRKYAGLLIVSILLTAFLSVVGRMETWLGPNGEGLMNAFSVADHDLGVQPFNNTVPMDEIERIINWYSPVKEKYELAMQSVTVNGQEYTANVLNDISYFHILKGSPPDGSEILITDTVANEQGLTIGDSVQIAANGRSERYTVSGIYECANGMGSNIGMSMEGYSKVGDVTGFIWCYHYILEDGSVRDYAMTYLQEHYTDIDVHTNAWSGLDGIVSMMRLLIVVIYIITAVLILTAVSLVASKLLKSETQNMAIYKSIGIREKSLRLSFALRFLITSALGAIIGTELSCMVADSLIGQLFRSFGIGSFSAPFDVFGILLPPTAVALLFFGFAWLVTSKIKKVSMIKLISENDE